MEPSASEVRETLRRLRRTTQHIKSTTSGLTDAQLRRPPGKGEWSILELLAHIRGAATVQGGWIERMLTEETPTLRYSSPRTGMRKLDLAPGFEAFFRAFTQERAALVKTLSALALQDWSRSAAFTGTKPGWTQTVFDAASGIAAHERSHFEQISEAARLAK